MFIVCVILFWLCKFWSVIHEQLRCLYSTNNTCNKLNSVYGVWVNDTVCILRGSRRLERNISDLVASENEGSSPHFEKWGLYPPRTPKITPMLYSPLTSIIRYCWCLSVAAGKGRRARAYTPCASRGGGKTVWGCGSFCDTKYVKLCDPQCQHSFKHFCFVWRIQWRG